MAYWICFLVTILFYIELPSTATCETGTIIPLYIYPSIKAGNHTWQPLIDAHKKYSSIPVWAIVNSNNGPGLQVDRNYAEAIDMLKANRIHTLGYVSTNYTQRNISLVKKDVDTWIDFYAPEGIFFDEMTNENIAEQIDYYKQLNDYAKQQKFIFTVGNPGTDVDLNYVNTVDTIMIYEKSGSFPIFDENCGATANYPIKKWGVFPYNLPSIKDIEANIIAAKNCVGFIYATDDYGANPWDSLSSYLEQLFALLKN